MTPPVRFDVSGKGYAQVRAGDGCLLEHRLLAYAWGMLDSPWFSEDAREIHHVAPEPHDTPCRWLPLESHMTALSPAEHRERCEGRSGIVTPWDRLERGAERPDA